MMNKEFTVLTEVELIKVDGGKRYPNCTGKFLGGLAKGAALGAISGGVSGAVLGGNIG